MLLRVAHSVCSSKPHNNFVGLYAYYLCTDEVKYQGHTGGQVAKLQWELKQYGLLTKSIMSPQPTQVLSAICYLWLEPSGIDIKMILLVQHHPESHVWFKIF